MGASPTGFRFLDMAAPTRRRRAARPAASQSQTGANKSSQAVASSLTELNNPFDAVGKEPQRPVASPEPPSPKRKSAGEPEEEPSPKRTRLEENAAEENPVAEPQAETSATTLEHRFREYFLTFQILATLLITSQT